ncbi:MAG: NAD(P)/FAD-dependent oxidoreductase [Nitrospirota bacterium]|nr:MAG: NAD(P)/FAD-dependent oxidoreductase [Nitrospirota bacterium]
MKRYDVIIVGCGPAGIFCALEILNQRPNARILMLDKGKDIIERSCPMKTKNRKCIECKECDLLSGWGGAGAFSDGKLSLSADVGGHLSRYIDRDELDALIDYVDGIYIKFGAPETTYGEDIKKIEKLQRLAKKNDLTLIPSKIRHIGTDRCKTVLQNLKEHINGKVNIEFLNPASQLVKDNGSIKGIETADGDRLFAEQIVLAPGREGSQWLEMQGKELGLTLLNNPVDIGVRVEVPAPIFEPLTKITYEPKLLFYSKKFDDMIRTFCVNPYGEVVKEYLKDVWTVNGHSYANRRTDNTNFALLVSTGFTEPFNEPISYGRYISRLANFLGKGVILQRLGDLQKGRRSTEERIKKGLVQPTLKDATPGDLSFALPYRYLSDILEMLEALDRIAPGVNSRHTLLYGVEAKFYSMQIRLTNTLQTEISNLFAIGDGAGVSRGLIQASASGVIAAREICKRLS